MTNKEFQAILKKLPPDAKILEAEWGKPYKEKDISASIERGRWKDQPLNEIYLKDRHKIIKIFI